MTKKCLKKKEKKKTHIYLYFVVYRKIEGLEEDKNIKKKKREKWQTQF